MLSIFKSPLLGVRKFLAAESPLKLMKNAFYITLKALFVLKIFKFCRDFLVIRESDLVRKLNLISKFVTSKTGKQLITIHM